MKRKIAVSIPEETLRTVKRAVREGEAPSISAYVSDALAEKAARYDLQDLLDEWDRELGPPGPEAMEWAKKFWKREDEHWMRVRSSRSSAGTRGSAQRLSAQGVTSSPRRSLRRSGATAVAKRGSRSSSSRGTR